MEDCLEKNEKPLWWKRRTHMKKSGILFLTGVGFLAVGLATGVCVIRARQTNERDDNNVTSASTSGRHARDVKTVHEECTTRACFKSAETILHYIDRTVDPCEDFYQFACGSHLKNLLVPDAMQHVNYNRYVTQGEITRKIQNLLEEPIEPNEPKPFVLAKKMYKTCTNTKAIEADGLDTIKVLLKNVGGWPVLEGPSWNETGFDWKKCMIEFRRKGFSAVNFFKVYVKHNSRNPTSKIISIDEGDFDIPVEYLTEGYSNKLVQSYASYMFDLAVLFGANKKVAEDDVKITIDFLINLAEATHNRGQDDDFPFRIDILQKGYGVVPWLEFINNLIDNPNKRINSTYEVFLRAPAYLRNLEKLLKSSSKRAQANFAFFRAVHCMTRYLPDSVSVRAQQFRNSLYWGSYTTQPRDVECAEKVSANLKQAVDALYVRKHFREDTKRDVISMVKDIQNEFIKAIEKSDWMDAAMKGNYIDKAESMAIHVGYPVEYFDDQKLEEYYEKLDFNEESSVEVANRITKFIVDSEFEHFDEPYNRTDWKTRIPSTSIDAVYLIEENSIQIPAGLLQGMFYNKDRPNYMNYATLGWIIGHQITHGFDKKGSKYNKMGKLNPWTDDSDQAHDQKAKCFVDQYSEYLVPEIGIPLNGEHCQRENVADNVGLKLAYSAYNSWLKRKRSEYVLPGLYFTTEQLFWIAAGNVWCSVERKEYLEHNIKINMHSPSRYRVLVAFSNMPNFADDFRCRECSKMRAKTMCQIW